MDIRIELDGKERGTIPYESLSAVYYLFQEMGFQVRVDTGKQKVELKSVLHGIKIFLSTGRHVEFHTYRKEPIELKMMEQLQKFLTACGVNVFFIEEKELNERADLQVRLSLFEIPVLKEPILELTHNLKSNHQRLVNILQCECKKMGTKFKCIETVNDTDVPFIKINIMYADLSDEEFWRDLGEQYALAITMGILARFQGKGPLSVFSFIPLEVMSKLFIPIPSGNTEQEEIVTKKERLFAENKKIVLNKPIRDRRKEAEVFFDYHFLLEEQEGYNKIKIIGNLHIKNSGTEVLRNPVICLRTNPSENIKLIGQIVPPNTVQTMGVMNGGGTKGWRYMNDDWFEEVEKGETWICPIQSIDIAPQQTESLSNLQISFLNPEEQSNIRVEAFVFFKEQNLECTSNNQISLIVKNKQE